MDNRVDDVLSLILLTMIPLVCLGCAHFCRETIDTRQWKTPITRAPVFVCELACRIIAREQAERHKPIGAYGNSWPNK